MAKRTIIFILLLALTLGVAAPAAASAEHAGELEYTVTVPAGREASADHLRDDDYRTRLTLTSGQSLTIAWQGEADGVLLQWFDEKQWYSRDCGTTIRFYSEDNRLLSETVYSPLSYRMYLPAEGASRMEILAVGGRAPMISLCEAKVLAPGAAPANLTRREKVDLMLILSGVSDELDMLGGLLPLYAGEHGIKTAVVYLGRDDGNQVQEAFRVLDAMGLDVIPLFLQQEDHMAFDINRVSYLWKGAQLKREVTDLIHTYGPRVVVSCDPDDEQTRARARFTAQLVRDAVTRQTTYSDLQVQKLYLLSSVGGTALDGNVPLAVYGGRTALDVAEEGYARYLSEASFGTILPQTPRFDLIYTTVGQDEAKDDLFEHIDRSALIAYQAPTPVPTATPEPTPAPTEAPTAVPTDTPVSTEAPSAEPTAAPTAAPTESPAEEGEETGKSALIQWIGSLGRGAIALYVASGVFVIVALCLVKKNRSMALLLLVMAGLLAYVGYSLVPKGDEAELDQTVQTTSTPSPVLDVTPAPMDTPRPTDTPEPTEAPAPEPTVTPEPTPSPDPNDQYFRQPGEPAEVVIQDYEYGHWEYRSDILSVLIDRENTSDEKGHPYVKYVAHVRMRKVNSFRSAVSARTEIAMAIEPPWRLARNYRAVLAVTGDNINEAEADQKGILIRSGILYSDRAGDSTMVINDDLTMQVYHPRQVSGLDLLDSGVTAAYSFGPILVENGQVCPDVDKHRVKMENPRCGVGLIEPGHFLVIVSDGRDARRAYGYTLREFAQIFVDRGAQVAYNLDGGASAGMVFMGEHINWQSAKAGQRTWADALLWGYSQLVPKVTDEVNHYGDGAKH